MITTNKSLKYFKLAVKRGDVDSQIRAFFINQINNIQGFTKLDFEYYNIKGLREWNILINMQIIYNKY